MDWQDEYKRKLCSAQDALGHIKNGDLVLVAHATGEPTYLLQVLVENAARYENVRIMHMVSMGKAEYCKPEYEKNFRHVSLFAGPTSRKAIEDGRGDFVPAYFSEIPGLFRTRLRPNVALVNLSPPDEHGYCSYGVSVDYTKPAVESSDICIAQINKYMPRTYGDSFVHISELDYIVEQDYPVIELPIPEISDVERAIGAYCASLVNDGDTLQLGIGALPDAVVQFLKDKNDLGIHSEMIADGVAGLVKKGVVTNKRKTLYPGKIVISFIMGTRAMYDFAHNNPMIQMMTVDYVNNPVVIAQNDNMVSINSCIQVDLMGQVVSTAVGLRQISGVGGQVDFVRGANMSKNGRTIIAMPSTAGGGKISKIVPFIDQGAAVTTSRYDVNYVVTEQGIACLKGRTLRERARELIGVSHPDFRGELIAEYERRFHAKW